MGCIDITMETQLQDKVVIITGAAGTIGSASAEAFVREGATVILADVDVERGTRLAAELSKLAPGKACFLECDLRSDSSIEALVTEAVKRYGGIDSIICNAVIYFFDSLTEWSSLDALDKHYAVGLRGHTALIREAWRQSPRSRSGSVVTLSSIAGHVAEPNAFAYTPIKAAQKGLTLSCSIDMAKYGGWAVTISPGHTWSTPHEQRAQAEGLNRREYEETKTSIQNTMFGRFLEPAEVANWIVIAASALGKGLTGQDIKVSFGIEAGGFNRAYQTGLKACSKD